MKYFLSIFLIFFVGCTTQIKYPDGGFDYPKNIVAKDTNLYFYPLKDIEPKKEAFQDAYTYLFYQPFDEPNLSIKPQANETFRLTYGTAFGNSIIIILTQGLIIVKKGTPHNIYSEDTSHLSAIEKFHLALLKRRFPIDTSGEKPFLKHYLDSLTKLYPQLLDPAYYHKIYEKTIVRNEEKFTYAVNKIILTEKQYNELIEQINSSGFWAMPTKVDCEDPPNDGYGFYLEANTHKKYKIVSTTGCPDDTTKFTKACQRIIELAKLDKEINLVWKGDVIIQENGDLPDVKEK